MPSWIQATAAAAALTIAACSTATPAEPDVAGASQDAIADVLVEDSAATDSEADTDVATLADATATAAADGAATDAADADAVDASATADAVDVAAVGTPDPMADGPYTLQEFDDKATIASTGDVVAVHVALPNGGPGAGPYPLVILAHGFQLQPSQYYGYVKRLATFGYVAITVDFPTSLLGNDNAAEAKDLSGAIDWALASSKLSGLVDKSRVGISGHSLGGKLAIYAAATDPRFGAVFAMDPVDGGGPLGCNPPQCVDASNLMPSLTIPTAFMGETADAAGGMQPCAPAANNFATFYAGATSPSLVVTVSGANHMSFLDSTANCLACGFCNKATASNADVTQMTRSFMVAFFERRLRGLVAYDDFLTGATAQSRYVSTNLAKIESK
jgi:chlorophyllase